MLIQFFLFSITFKYLFLYFFLKDVLQVRLSVLGVGGAGCNAVNTMVKNGMPGKFMKIILYHIINILFIF